MKIIFGWMFVSIAMSAVFAGESDPMQEWEVVPSQDIGTQANALNAVAAAADNDVWAVGDAYDQQLSAYRTVIEHWNGASWSVIPSPNASDGYNLLNGVAAATPNDVWAVGQAWNGNNYDTLTLHWRGAKEGWNIVPGPNVAGNSNVLIAVTAMASDDIWAVGYSADSNFNNHALAMHWNGGQWSITPTPAVGSDILYAVTASGPNDVWAVGRTRQGYSNGHTLTMHWDGQIWSVVPSPNGPVGSNSLYGVAQLAANDVWAVGSSGSSATLAIHWDGAAWSIVHTPGVGSNPALVGIVAVNQKSVWTAGQSHRDGLQSTLAERWDGASWSVVESPNPDSSSNRLEAIAATPNGTLWAVGVSGPFGQPEQTLILRRRPKT